MPERVLTNHDLEKMVETSDEWISTRTGIKERRIAEPGEKPRRTTPRRPPAGPWNGPACALRSWT